MNLYCIIFFFCTSESKQRTSANEHKTAFSCKYRNNWSSLPRAVISVYIPLVICENGRTKYLLCHRQFKVRNLKSREYFIELESTILTGSASWSVLNISHNDNNTKRRKGKLNTTDGKLNEKLVWIEYAKNKHVHVLIFISMLS